MEFLNLIWRFRVLVWVQIFNLFFFTLFVLFWERKDLFPSKWKAAIFLLVAQWSIDWMHFLTCFWTAQEVEMEHGSLTDLSSSTFSLMDEDHTLANSVRYTLNKEWVFCKYNLSSIFWSCYLLDSIFFRGKVLKIPNWVIGGIFGWITLLVLPAMIHVEHCRWMHMAAKFSWDFWNSLL